MITIAMLQSEHDLGRVFSWQARVGIGPKFGTCPIGWYQVHHMHASEAIIAAAQTAGVCQTSTHFAHCKRVKG